MLWSKLLKDDFRWSDQTDVLGNCDPGETQIKPTCTWTQHGTTCARARGNTYFVLSYNGRTSTQMDQSRVVTSWSLAEPAQPSPKPCPETSGGTQNLLEPGRTRREPPNRHSWLNTRARSMMLFSLKFAGSGCVRTLPRNRIAVTVLEFRSVTRRSHVKLRRAKRDKRTGLRPGKL